MVGAEGGGDGGAHPQPALHPQPAAGLLRRQAEEGQAQAHLPGGAGGGEGVGDAGQELRGHAPSVVGHSDPEEPLPLLHRQVHMLGPGGDGVLGDVQDMERELFHPAASSRRPGSVTGRIYS